MRTVDEYSMFMALVKKNYAKQIVLHESSEDIQDILRRYPRLVVAMNHGPMAGPLAGSIAMMDQYGKNGGENRKPIIIAWRGLYRIPVVRHLVRYMSQVRTPPNLDGFVKKLTKDGFTDLFVMPEGENCSFGNGLDIEPFLSPRFVELALRAGTPILIAVYVGSEVWSNIIPVSNRLDPLLRMLPKKTFERIQDTRRINLSPMRLKAIPKLQISFKLYHPKMTAADLHSDDVRVKLEKESNAVRAIMQGMVDAMAHHGDDMAYA